MPRERRRSPLASLGPFAAGLVVGVALGLPTAHAIVQLMSPPATAAALTPSSSASPAASAPSSSSPTPVASSSPAPASPSLSLTPPAPSVVCPALAAGQPALDELAPPPTGYGPDVTLGWLGCGTSGLPPGEPVTALHLAQRWLLALAYTCPLGTAGSSPGTTLSVVETGPGAPSLLGGESGDAGRAIIGGTDGSAFPAGSPQLEIEAPAACLWHVALYVAQP